MTIKRQYNLPNCRLVLEGVDDDSPEGKRPDRRPLLSILIHAECHFTGIDQTLSGGKDFLESLVKAVSAYAQEFLSGIRHPVELAHSHESVRFSKGNDPDRHHLLWQHKSETKETEAELKPLHFDLNTIQLFDLVEAVDQLFADSRTLPDLSLHLIPVSRRHRKADVPLAKRATPMVAGMGSLAIAAALLFMLPIPEVKEPEVIQGENTSENASEEPSNEPTATPIPPEDLQALLTEAPEITDPTEMNFLQRHLRREIENAWDNRDEIERDLTYNLVATLDGSIIDYEPVGDITEAETELTPLSSLRFLPTEDDIAQREAIAKFEFVFTQNETTTISPLAGRRGRGTLGERITDPEILAPLQAKIREKLEAAWTPETPVAADLPFRIGVTETGEIADYEYLDGNAYLLQKETPLPQLLDLEAADIGEESGTVVPQKPLAQFRVVFLQNGAIEMSRY